MGTVVIYVNRYTVDEIVDGSVPDRTAEEVYDQLSAADAVELLRTYGLAFEGRHAYHPDGSYTSDYQTGEQTDISAALGDDWPPRVARAIRASLSS